MLVSLNIDKKLQVHRNAGKLDLGTVTMQKLFTRYTLLSSQDVEHFYRLFYIPNISAIII